MFDSVVTFEIIKPENLIKTFHLNVDIKNNALLSSKFSQYFVALFVAAFGFLVIFIASRARKFEKKGKKLVGNIIKKTMWNNTIRSLSLSYFEFCLNMKFLVDTHDKNAKSAAYLTLEEQDAREKDHN